MSSKADSGHCLLRGIRRGLSEEATSHRKLVCSPPESQAPNTGLPPRKKDWDGFLPGNLLTLLSQESMICPRLGKYPSFSTDNSLGHFKKFNGSLISSIS